LSWIAGVVLSRLVEPRVVAEKLILAGGTPAIHLCSRAPGTHPLVLLAHGVTASKETLFRPGEALAAAAFDCYAVDLADMANRGFGFPNPNCCTSWIAS
jgi:alpha-beta hydrolase superfamily lysophospholipase